MSTISYTLHEYDHGFDSGLAQMWNESDDQWPGTFTDGVPLTEERVREWMDRLEVIIQFIVVEDQTGKVVGYGDLWDTAVRPKSCYVALLNVHPQHQGKSLARRMLVRMVDWAAENGYDRLTIGTWPANLKAMPLYKKVGFFWKPGTSVYMENYLAGARRLPAATDFFEKHSWYGTYDRALEQVEDDQTHSCTGDTKVYIMRWQAEGDLFETVFDRNAQALTGIETNDWAVYARTSEAEPAQGFRYPFEWELHNKSDQPLPVRLKARGDEGITIKKKAAFTLQPGESRRLAAEFVVAQDAPTYQGHHEDIPTPRVDTALDIAGKQVELGTGLRYRQAVEFSIHPEIVTIFPGVQQTVHVQLHNHMKTPLSGTVRIDLDGSALQTDWLEAPFEAPAEGFAGLPLTLTASEAGSFPLRISAALEGNGNLITKPKLVPIISLAPGGIAAAEGDEELLLENDFFRVRAKARAGEALIINKDTGMEDARWMEEIGPAFVPWDLHEQQYDLHLETGANEVKAIMTARSTRFPGLVVGREITVNASPLIRVRGWIANNTEESFDELVFRPHLRMASENRRMITVPLTEGLVREHGSQFAVAEEDLPKKPERYAEDWLAYDENGRALGLIWAAAGVDKIDSEFGRHFFWQPLPLEAGETRYTRAFHVYCGPGDWRAVRGAWRRLKGIQARDVLPAPSNETRSYAQVRLEDEPLVTLGGAIETRFCLDSTREYVLTGSAAVRPPAGWQADLKEIEFELDFTRPLDLPLHLETEAPVGAAAGELQLTTQIFDRSTSFTVIRLGDRAESVVVEKKEDSGQQVWEIDSGHSCWTIAPEFHGGVTAWRERGSNLNHLLTSFPEEGELSWMKPFFGGLWPMLDDPDADGGWPGKLHEEHFEVRPLPLETGDLPWNGVRLNAEVKAEKFRGLRVELDYMTLPGSNALKVVYRLLNDTPVYRKARHGWLAFEQVDGGSKDAVLHTPEYDRKRTPHGTWGINHRWAAIENPGTGRALVTVHASGKKEMQSIDMGVHGAHTFVRETCDVPPQGAVERVAYYVLAEDMAQARYYAALAEWGE